MYKATVCMTRKEDMSPEEYREYYENSHAPRVDDLVGIREYTLTFTEGEDSPYDSVAELYFEDEAAYDRAMSSDLMSEPLGDPENFTKTDEMLLLAGEESVLIDTAAASN